MTTWNDTLTSFVSSLKPKVTNLIGLGSVTSFTRHFSISLKGWLLLTYSACPSQRASLHDSTPAVVGYGSYISDPGDAVACNWTHTCNSFCLFSISTVTFQRGTYVCKFTRAGLRAFPRRLFCQHFCTCLCFKRFHFSCSVDCYISTLIIFSLVEVRKWTPMGIGFGSKQMMCAGHDHDVYSRDCSRYGVQLGHCTHQTIMQGPKGELREDRNLPWNRGEKDCSILISLCKRLLLVLYCWWH